MLSTIRIITIPNIPIFDRIEKRFLDKLIGLETKACKITPQEAGSDKQIMLGQEKDTTSRNCLPGHAKYFIPKGNLLEAVYDIEKEQLEVERIKNRQNKSASRILSLNEFDELTEESKNLLEQSTKEKDTTLYMILSTNLSSRDAGLNLAATEIIDLNTEKNDKKKTLRIKYRP